jgi:hypothetical protein
LKKKSCRWLAFPPIQFNGPSPEEELWINNQLFDVKTIKEIGSNTIILGLF